MFSAVASCCRPVLAGQVSGFWQGCGSRQGCQPAPENPAFPKKASSVWRKRPFWGGSLGKQVCFFVAACPAWRRMLTGQSGFSPARPDLAKSGNVCARSGLLPEDSYAAITKSCLFRAHLPGFRPYLRLQSSVSVRGLCPVPGAAAPDQVCRLFWQW